MSELEKKKRQSTWYEKQGLIAVVLLLNLGLGWNDAGSSILSVLCLIILVGTIIEATIKGVAGKNSGKKIEFDKKIWGFLLSLLTALIIYGVYSVINTIIWR